MSTEWVPTVMIQQLIQRLEAVRPGPGEAKALVERMQNGTLSESDRQRLRAILEAEAAALACLAAWNPPSLARQGYRRTQRKKQLVKRWRRRHRREMRGSTAGHRVGAALNPLRSLPSLHVGWGSPWRGRRHEPIASATGAAES